jgi:hypothetical protein
VDHHAQDDRIRHLHNYSPDRSVQTVVPNETHPPEMGTVDDVPEGQLAISELGAIGSPDLSRCFFVVITINYRRSKDPEEEHMKQVSVAMFLASVAPILLHAQQPPNPVAQQGGRGRGNSESPLAGPRVDVLHMARPIDIHDTVWIEDLTSVEVRDLVQSGKTTALIIVGGMEDNGPYLPVGKHGTVMKIEAEAIARKLGNALIAPMINTAPGRPDHPGLPGRSPFRRRRTAGC